MLPAADLGSLLRHDVSRETQERLIAFSRALEKWSGRINLIARSTTADIWTRHILDAAQLIAFAPENPRIWCDLGSGGGLPGIVIACVLAQTTPDCEVVLIESDARKAAFLTMVSRELSIKTRVLTARIEVATPVGADVVSARALAPLPLLLSYVARHLGPGGVALLPKGRNHAQEVEAARHSWHFDLHAEPGRVDPDGAILVVRNLSPVDQTR